MGSEKEIENSILAYLKSLPDCFAWKNQSTGVYDPTRGVFRKSNNKFHINGVSDILGIYKGKFLAIEVKTPKNKTRPAHQKAFISEVNKRGGIAFFATSIEEVKENLVKVTKNSGAL